MGYSKSDLPFGPEKLLQRVVRRLKASVSPIVVVHASGQVLPNLGDQVICVADDEPNQGPLRGLACGLTVLQNRCDFAFATSCDAPFLTGEFIRRLEELRQDKRLAMLTDQQRHYPLCAIYATDLGAIAMELLIRGTRRPIALLDHADHNLVSVDSLRSNDPELVSLINVNDPNTYRQALERAGLPIDEDFFAKLRPNTDSDRPN